MPSIIDDPSLSPLIAQSTTIFDWPDTPAPSVLSFQVVPTQALPDRTVTATGMLLPDLILAQRLANFPENLYDLNPSSALMHFMAALMGAAGAGQIRQRQQVARLQGMLCSTSFYDLDGFYGSLFGALRGPSASFPVNPATGQPFNPYTDLACADGWDQILALDAVYRERIIALAKAIALGGTVPGLRALAEAVAGVPCRVDEVWQLVAAQGAQGPSTTTWNSLQASYPTWNAFPVQTWGELTGVVVYGGQNINIPTEVLITPRRNYDNSAVGQQQRAADLWGITRVCEVLKPEFTIVDVVTTGQDASVAVPFMGLWADSDYWEVSVRALPEDTDDFAYDAMRKAYVPGAAAGAADGSLPQGLPPFCQSQGTQYSYLADVSHVTTFAKLPAEDGETLTSMRDYERESFPSGLILKWGGLLALMDPTRAASARTASAVSTKAAPYSGPRAPMQGAT
jgi:hypothetical protein